MQITKKIKKGILFICYPNECAAVIAAFKKLGNEERVPIKTAGFSNMFKNSNESGEDAFVFLGVTSESQAFICIDNEEREVTLYIPQDEVYLYRNQIYKLMKDPGKGYSIFSKVRISKKDYALVFCHMNEGLAISFRKPFLKEKIKEEIEEILAC